MIQVYECLGDIVGFSGPDVRVLKDLYDRIPSEFKEDFDQVLESARSAYYSLHEDNKRNNIKSSPTVEKRQIVETMINPFLYKHNLGNYKAVRTIVKSINPGIPGEEKVTIARKSPVIEQVDTTEVADLFDNFDWDAEIIKEEAPVPSLPNVDIGFADLFEDDEVLDLDDFSF